MRRSTSTPAKLLRAFVCLWAPTCVVVTTTFAAEWVQLAVYPPRVVLDSAHEGARLIVVATRDDGVTHDATSEAQLELASDGLATLGGDARLAAVAGASGDVRCTARWKSLVAHLDVTVRGADQPPGVSFRRDVMPIFMKAGCNSGTCHGMARGKDGFRLSLFGFDPPGDYFRLTREQATRRIDCALPEESLLLEKATGAVPHTGGKRFSVDSPYYRTLRDWIAGGAVDDGSTASTATQLDVYPPRIVLEGPGAAQTCIASATYDDGTTRDVTDLAVFLSTDPAVAKVDPSGIVQSVGRGETLATARFATHTIGVPTFVLPPGGVYEAPTTQSENRIDELIEAKLRLLRMGPSPLATDAEFLRRATLDLAGRMPTRVEWEEFLADERPDRRSRWIDQLVEEPAFSRLWAKRLAEALLVRTETNRVDYKPMFLYWQWLQDQVASGTPLDQTVRRLLTASGSTLTNPAGNFFQIEPQPEKVAENVAQALLGIRIQCAQCHHHPFDRWTMDDYYGFAAFFSQVGRKRSDDQREYIVFDRRGGETRHPLDNRIVLPKHLGGDAPGLTGGTRRQAIATWIVTGDNPYFAQNMANRLWAHFFGVGVVEPVDDHRATNPPSNPELLSELARRLVAYGFDVRRLARDICNSHAYQRSSTPTSANAGDQRNFSHAGVRRISAETLLDCIGDATGAPEKLAGLPLGARATELADGRAEHYFLQTFGRSRRETVCACETRNEPTLSQALHMLNGETIFGKIVAGRQIEKWLDEGKTPAETVTEIHVRCLARKPTAAEQDEFAELYGAEPRPVEALQDVFWAVLNSREFLFNH